MYVFWQCAACFYRCSRAKLCRNDAEKIAVVVDQRATGIARLQRDANLKKPAIILRPRKGGNFPTRKFRCEALETDSFVEKLHR